jgi:hypothetical protein
VANGDEGIRVIALGLAGRRDEARGRLEAMSQQPAVPLFKMWTSHLRAWLDKRSADMVLEYDALRVYTVFEDPEAIFQEGWLFCDAGDHARGLPFLERALAHGYFAATTLKERPQFDALRADSAFQSLLADAEAGRALALTAFRQAGGERLLGR